MFERPLTFYFKGKMKKIKHDNMGVKNINVLVGENEISYLKTNENENNFIGNLYDHGLLIFGNQLSFK
jgi:hypothetical protein